MELQKLINLCKIEMARLRVPASSFIYKIRPIMLAGHKWEESEMKLGSPVDWNALLKIFS